MVKSKPFVSALIVTRNEIDYIETSLSSLVNQTYPSTSYEIIVIDGMSEDGTREKVRELISANPDKHMELIDNPKYILATGWNIGIKASKGDYVIRIDAHAKAAEDFIEKSVDTMERVPDAVCVGGKLITESMEGDNNLVSIVLSSPFGVGNSAFRVSDTAVYADTAVYGLYRKTIFEKAGYFNEQYQRNQDIELHARIKAAGGRFYFNPEITCVYYSRNTVRKMLKQAFGNGKWNMVMLKHHHSALSLRHLVPFAFVLFLIISAAVGFVWRPAWYLELGVLILHLLLGAVAGTKKTKKCSEIIKMPFLFMALHIAYGAGYLSGITTNIDEEKE